MKWTCKTTLWCGFLSVLFLTSRAEADLAKDLPPLLEKYQPRFEELSDLGLGGHMREANQKLLALTNEVPGPAMCLMIGNLLYRVDPDASYSLHKNAYEARPDDPAAGLEWAMEQQRKREYREAVGVYKKYLAVVPGDKTKQALLADCLVRTGNLREAVAAWTAAEHGHYHTEIDFAICEIYGGLSPARRRDDLLSKINTGDNSLLEALIFLDLHYDTDWWNKDINAAALKNDLALAEKRLGKESPRYQDLKPYLEFASDPELSAASLKNALLQAGLILGDNGKLPQSSLIAHDLAERTIEEKLATRTTLLQRFEKPLSERFKSANGDKDALNLLCYLYVNNSPVKLSEADRYGWDHFNDARFAGSYLAGLAAGGKLDSESADLKKAVQQFPEDSTIRLLQIRAFGESKATAELITSAIEAEYRKLSVGMGMQDSYNLNRLFALLGQKLDHVTPEK